MPDAVVENLILDLLEWLARRDRTYRETMDAWRTSCPKLPVWEDANDAGLVSLTIMDGSDVNGSAGNRTMIVRVSASGLALLAQHRRRKA
jgi:hypothetical protein